MRNAARSASDEGLGRSTSAARANRVTGEQPISRCYRAVVLDFHPGLGGLVEEVERQLRQIAEHLHQASLEIRPETLLLSVLIGAVGKRLSRAESRAVATPRVNSSASMAEPLSLINARGRPHF